MFRSNEEDLLKKHNYYLKIMDKTLGLHKEILKTVEGQGEAGNEEDDDFVLEGHIHVSIVLQTTLKLLDTYHSHIKKSKRFDPYEKEQILEHISDVFEKIKEIQDEG